jgi:hypothetical protein
MEEIDETKSLPTKIGAFLSKDISLSLSLAYVALIGIGMMFSYQYYDIWGIDIFQFAGFGDFLLAPFRDMMVFFFVVISVLISFFAVGLSRKLDRKYPHLSKYWNLGVSVESKNYNRLMNFNGIFGIVVYLHLSSVGYSIIRRHNFKKHPERYRVEIEQEDNMFRTFLLIGLTENYVILMSESDNQVFALPLEGGVRSIRFPAGTVKFMDLRQSSSPASGRQAPN